MADLRYPIGDFDLESANETRQEAIREIAELPAKLSSAVRGLSDEQLDTPYRPDGWTVRQVVHHVADSHINALVRFKLAMTETNPTIRPYDESEWAKLADAKMPVEPSLELLKALHARWANLLESMSDSEFERRLDHPESGSWSLDGMLRLYSWHGRHHTAHITSLATREGWRVGSEATA